MLRKLLLLFPLAVTGAHAGDLPSRAERAADHAVRHYDAAQIELLADLVTFETVHTEGVANAENPEFRDFAEYVSDRAEAFGLDFTDFCSVLIVSLGNAEERLGVITHGDVQPVDPSKWAKSPFVLDTDSEPGRLIARGTEDDKAAIATALYAMKTLKELGTPLERRIELWISLTEESDWEPFREVLAKYPPPEVNIGIDSEYPVVVAEKGWGRLIVKLAAGSASDPATPNVRLFEGGAFISQVPEDARIEIVGADDAMRERIRQRADADDGGVEYTIEQQGNVLSIVTKGKAAHSSTPEYGLNAITHAAALLQGEKLTHTAGGRAVHFTNELLGTGLYGRRFGNAAYSHEFMGPLTVNLSTVKTGTNEVELAINTRAPAGKPAERLEAEMRDAIAGWAQALGIETPPVETLLTDAYLPQRPEQVEPLLAVFRHYTGNEDAEPISIGGGTNARLLPNGVNFGPSMPGVPYTGHSEHEYITREQMTLNLKMYAAMLAWIAGREEGS